MDALTYMYLLLADAYKTTQRKLIPWGLNSYTSFKISNVLEPSISQQCIYVVLFALPCMGWRALIECPESAIFLFWMVVKIYTKLFTPGDDYPVAVFAFKATLRIDNKRIIIMLKCYYYFCWDAVICGKSSSAIWCRMLQKIFNIHEFNYFCWIEPF